MISNAVHKTRKGEISAEIAVKIVERTKYLRNSDNKKASFVVLLSTADELVLTIGTDDYLLNRYQAVVVNQLHVNNISVKDQDITILVISGELANRYIGADRLNRVLTFQAGDDIITSITALGKATETGAPAHRIAAIGFSILMDIFTYREKTDTRPRIVIQAIDIIENDYAFLYGVDDLADKIGVSKSHLIRVFHQYMNITPGKYLENHRISQAKLFLASGEMRIEAVAGLCGYANTNYFGKVFKKQTGITPKRYMKDQQSQTPQHRKIPDDIYL